MRANRSTWKTAQLGQLATFTNGRAFKPEEWASSGVPIIRIQNLNGGSEFNYFEGEFDRSVEVCPGDILFGWSGSRGTSFGATRWNGPAGILNQHIFKVQPSEDVHPGFLYHLLRHVTGRIEARAHGAAGLVHVKKGELTRFEVHVPSSLATQKAISYVLDLCEQHSSKRVRLLAEKHRQKRGLLHELITGRRRPSQPGGSGVAMVSLGDHAFELSERNRRGMGRERVMGVIKGVGLEPMRDHVRASDLSRYKVVPPDAFAYNPMRLNIGSIARSHFAEDCLVSPDYVVFQTDRSTLLPAYLDQLRHSRIWRQFVQPAGSGSVRVRIYFRDLAKMRIPLPPLAEQHRIASTLEALDREIALLEQLRAAYDVQKRGIMQRLLAGDLRVPESAASEPELIHG